MHRTPLRHPALFYRGADEYLAGTVPFVLDGLAEEEPVAVAVPPPNLELIVADLGPLAGSVEFIDMAEAGRNPGRIIPGVLFAFANAHAGRVRIIGEPIWPGRTEREYPACLQHEALINLAFRDRAATILCPYDSERLAPSVVADARATHPLLVDSAGYRPSRRYAPERVLAACNQPLPAAPEAVTLQFEAGGLSAVRHFAMDHAQRLGLAAARLDDLALAVAELSANSIVHGSGGGVLRLWRERGHLVCEVSDGGRIGDPLAGRRPVPPRQVGGRGLLMVNQVADLVRTYGDEYGTTIRTYLRL
ncbi:sensor histidine kinase [Amycolatopsis cihanbeyliensis]|uniref:Anti-sigma regulatory factor (Ser/Thr protein kinase) n=1 Tax=Amycolatopsis cihanbeyliensis TaxID=1128664 RepID=A0A542CTT2_AMYCI|nr:sensor histidine kinase [Amycolatopsis cihanbeyliensis]TQI94233.1 anti-sigma regulatory factor (Ser/Thr protein kinase) [Amycolatopsis cihanbeyliensis]